MPGYLSRSSDEVTDTRPRNSGSIPGMEKIFFSPQRTNQKRFPPNFLSWAPPGLKWLGCESNHLPLPCTEVQYEWNAISILLYASIIWYPIKAWTSLPLPDATCI